MTKPKNIKEAVKLIARYREVTIEEIKMTDVYIPSYSYYGKEVAHEITGFGDGDTCTMCIKVGLYCPECVYSYGLIEIDREDENCHHGKFEESYDRICKADTPRKLLNAFRHRADVIEKHLKNNNWI